MFLLNSFESRDFLKKENENFFDIDFRQEKAKTSEKKQDSDFFDFSMKPEKENLDFEVSEDVVPTVDALESIEENRAEQEVIDESTEKIIEENSNEIKSDTDPFPTDSQENTIDETDTESQQEFSEKENSVEDTESIVIENTQKENDDSNDDDNEIVIIEKTNCTPEEVLVETPVDLPADVPVESPIEVSPKVHTSPITDDDVIVNVVKWRKAAPQSQLKTIAPKKSNLVIELDDDFEIKMCNFRDLKKKENKSDNEIKKN